MSTGKFTESFIRGVKRKTRRRFTDEEKIRIVVEGLRGEESIAEICRREGIAQSLFYKWYKKSDDFPCTYLPPYNTKVPVNTVAGDFFFKKIKRNDFEHRGGVTRDANMLVV